MSSLWQTVSENVVFVLEFLALIVVMFLIAYVIEKAVKKKNSDTERVLATRKIVVIGVFSDQACVKALFHSVRRRAGKLLDQLHAGAACVRDLPVQKIEKTGDSRHRCGYTDHDGVWLLLQCHLSASEIF